MYSVYATARFIIFSFSLPSSLSPSLVQGTYAAWCPQLGNAARVSPDHFDYWTSSSHHGTGDLISTLANVGVHSGLQPDGGALGSVWGGCELRCVFMCACVVFGPLLYYCDGVPMRQLISALRWR